MAIILFLVFLVGCAGTQNLAREATSFFPEKTAKTIGGSNSGVSMQFESGNPPRLVIEPFDVKLNFENSFPDDVGVSLNVFQRNLDLKGFEEKSEEVVVPAAMFDENGNLIRKGTERASFENIDFIRTDKVEQTDFIAVGRYTVSGSNIVMQMCVDKPSEDERRSYVRCTYDTRFLGDHYKHAPITITNVRKKSSVNADGSVTVRFEELTIQNKGPGKIDSSANSEVDLDIQTSSQGDSLFFECLYNTQDGWKQVHIPGPVKLENDKATLRCSARAFLGNNQQQDYQIQFILSYPYVISDSVSVRVEG